MGEAVAGSSLRKCDVLLPVSDATYNRRRRSTSGETSQERLFWLFERVPVDIFSSCCIFFGVPSHPMSFCFFIPFLPCGDMSVAGMVAHSGDECRSKPKERDIDDCPVRCPSRFAHSSDPVRSTHSPSTATETMPYPAHRYPRAPHQHGPRANNKTLKEPIFSRHSLKRSTPLELRAPHRCPAPVVVAPMVALVGAPRDLDAGRSCSF